MNEGVNGRTGLRAFSLSYPKALTPMIRDNRPLIRGLISAFWFLEFSGSDAVEPDSAVQCMENIAADLHTLEGSDQLALRAELVRIVEEATDPTFKTFVRALPDTIGLAS